MTTAVVHRRPSATELILRALDRHPRRACIVGPDGRAFSYREVRDTVYRTARALHALGIRKGDGVALLSGNRPEAVTTQIAALVLGARFTPLHPLGSPADHAFVLDDSDCAALVVDPDRFGDLGGELAAVLPSAPRLLSLGPSADALDLMALARDQRATPLAVGHDESDLAILPYTGGTTGKPKGVMLPHRSLVHNAFLTLTEWEWPQEIRFLAATPVSHGVGMMIGPVLIRGGTVVLASGFDPERLLRTIEEERITATFVVPTMLYVLLDQPSIRDHDLSSLESVIYGASPMSPSRLAEALEVFGPVFMQLYAQTEAPNTVCTLRKEDHDPRRPELLSSCGAPLAGVDVELRAPDGRVVPPGEVGEICVRGPLVMDGYWRRPELTAETLRDGWLHTGDLARADVAGYLWIVDRAKDMIVSGGFNVYPREIEDVIGAHPEVAMAAVLGVPDAKWGEAVKAVVVPRPGGTVELDDIVALVRELKGPLYVPKSVDLVDSIPLTAVGKPDKRALRERYWSGHGRGVA